MSCLCLFLNYLNMQTVRKARYGDMLEGIVSNRCHQESIPGKVTIFGEKKKRRKERKDFSVFVWGFTVNLWILYFDSV